MKVFVGVLVVMGALYWGGSVQRADREQCVAELTAAHADLDHSYEIECRYGDR